MVSLQYKEGPSLPILRWCAPSIETIVLQGGGSRQPPVSCAAPPFGKADTVKVRVGFSPQTLSDTFTLLEYAPAGRIVDVAPTVISTGTSTELTLIGTNLRDVACRFDGVAYGRASLLMRTKLAVR